MRKLRTPKIKKANAILEYSIVFFIVVGLVAGVNKYLQKHIKARIKAESDTQLGTGQGLEWASSMSLSTSKSTFNREEEMGAGVTSKSNISSAYVSASAPPPSIKGWSVMEHKGSAVHVQDAASAAPAPSYPGLAYEDWQDNGTMYD